MSLSVEDVLSLLREVILILTPSLPNNLSELIFFVSHRVYNQLPQLKIRLVFNPNSNSNSNSNNSHFATMKRLYNRTLVGLEKGLFWEPGLTETVWTICTNESSPLDAINRLLTNVYILKFYEKI